MVNGSQTLPDLVDLGKLDLCVRVDMSEASFQCMLTIVLKRIMKVLIH